MTLVVFLFCLALTVRLTRLFCDDSITKPARDWLLVHRDPGGDYVLVVDSDPINGRTRTTTESYVQNSPKLRNHVFAFLSELFDCPWCTSVHVAFWVLLTSQSTSQSNLNWFGFAGVWAALAWITGLASTLVGVLHGAERVEAKAVEN